MVTYAQNISVADFYLDENDLTANLQGTTAMDQNGEKCALIKVITTQTGFTFDVGSLGVQKVEQKNGVIWVYVPQGVRKMSIFHQHLESLIDYAIPFAIEEAKTYVMKLKVPISSIDKSKQGRLVFTGVPNEALVTIGTMVEQRYQPEYKMYFDTYDYKIEVAGFYPNEGTVTIDDEINVKTVAIEMKPIMGQLNVNANPRNSSVIIGDKIYSATETIPLQIGKYNIIVKCNGYKEESRDVEIKENETTDVSISLSQKTNFTIKSTPSGAFISIDGDYIGSTPIKKEMMLGRHEVTATMPNYRTVRRNMDFNIDSPSIEIPLHYQYVRKDEEYFEVNAGYASIPDIGLTCGLYKNNFNAEFSYMYGIGKSETIYWNSDFTLPAETSYTPTVNLCGKVGYGVIIGTRFRITPQVGLSYMRLTETDNNADTKYGDGAYSMSTIASVKFSVKIAKKVGLSLTPGYMMPVIKSDGLTALSDASTKIEKWNNGINVNLGLILFM